MHSNAFTLQGLQRRLANARTVSEHSGDDEYRAISMSNADRARSSSRRNESVFSRFALRRVPWSRGRE